MSLSPSNPRQETTIDLTATDLKELIREQKWFDAIKHVEKKPADAEKADDHGLLPLHSVCACKAPREVMSALLDAYPHAVKTRDYHERTPLHHLFLWTLSYAAPEIDTVRLIVKAYPEARLEKDSNGMTPLRIACRDGCGITEDAFTELLTGCPEEVLVKDDTGRTVADDAFDNKRVRNNFVISASCFPEISDVIVEALTRIDMDSLDARTLAKELENAKNSIRAFKGARTKNSNKVKELNVAKETLLKKNEEMQEKIVQLSKNVEESEKEIESQKRAWEDESNVSCRKIQKIEGEKQGLISKNSKSEKEILELKKKIEDLEATKDLLRASQIHLLNENKRLNMTIKLREEHDEKWKEVKNQLEEGNCLPEVDRNIVIDQSPETNMIDV